MPPLGRRTPHGQDGFALIEVLVSALILAVVAAAVLTLMQSTARSANDERRHSEAYAIAQEDQARLRSTRLSQLNRLKQVTPITLDGTKFEVESTGVFVNNSSGTDSSCTSGETSADYVRVTSKVTWGGMGSRPAVTIQSIISPSTGSLDPNHGILIVTTKNAAGTALAGVGLTGGGTSTFSGTTDANGCANFADLPWGNYTVTASGSADLVAKNGFPPQAEPTSVIAGGTNTLPLEYDHAATLPVEYQYRVGSGSTFKLAKLDSVYVFNAKMNPARPYWTPSKARAASVTATPIFPFTTPDTVYAGACAVNNPTSGPGIATNVTLKPIETAPALKLQVPALELTVKNGSTPISGAKITITDDNCEDSGNPLKRIYASDANGHQNSSAAAPVTEPELGLPWGVYDICASANYSGSNHRLFSNNVSVKNYSSSVVLNLDLSGSGSESGSSKVCP
jgi:prepilin-type N-terminal cleavage/methylation domain-containing protein